MWEEHCEAMSSGRLAMVLDAGHEMEFVKMLALQRLREGVLIVENLDRDFVEGGWVDRHRSEVPEEAKRCLMEMSGWEDVSEGEGAEWYRLLGNPS